MSRATDGRLCYGILIEECSDFPWNNDEFDNEVENWWLKECNYSPINKNPYDENIKDEQKVISALYNKWWKEKEAFLKDNPIPFELVNYCSAECPMYIFAIPSTYNSANRGYPTEIDIKNLTYTKEEEKTLIKWCKKIFKSIEIEYSKPKWYLSSYCD